MLNFNFTEKDLGLVSRSQFMYDLSKKKKGFSCYVLLTDQISLSNCLYFWKYLVIFLLQLFVNEAVTS